jgi:membrane protein DedA with SNARE-associated domain
MNVILQFVVKHGYTILFAAAFAHQIGVPVPGPLFLLAAGALAAAGKLGFVSAVALVVVASVMADWIWYEAGRRRGERVLHFMHRFTRDPAYHNRKAKETFARYGLQLLLIAKFVPGLDAVAPPLAGTSRTSRVRFLVLDAIGSAIYACVYAGLGHVFSHDLDRAANYVREAGTVLAVLACIALLVFSAYKMLRRQRSLRESRTVPVIASDPTRDDDAPVATYLMVEGFHYGD